MSRSKAECVDDVLKTCIFCMDKANLKRTRTLLNFLFKHLRSVQKLMTARMTHLRLRLPIESGKAVNVGTDSVNEAEDQHISGLRLLSADFHGIDYYIICSAKLVEIG